MPTRWIYASSPRGVCNEAVTSSTCADSTSSAFARDLEDAGKARATVARRLCTLIGFYRYAEEEGAIERIPGVHIRRPRVDYESHVVGLDRNEVGAILVAAGLSSARNHALVSLMALNGLRVAEVVGTDIEALGLERGHRTLTALRKGGKTVTVPLAPRVARAIDLAIGERQAGPRQRGQTGPARGWADCAQNRPQSRERQASRAAHAAPRVHHCRTRRRRPAA
jgi:integrase